MDIPNWYLPTTPPLLLPSCHYYDPHQHINSCGPYNEDQCLINDLFVNCDKFFYLLYVLSSMYKFIQVKY